MKHDKFNNKKDNRMVSRTDFDNIEDLVKYLKEKKENQIFKNHCSSKNAFEPDYNDFRTYESALEGLEYGTELYFDEFKKNVKKVKDFLSKNQKNKNSNYKNDRVGFLPIVPKVLQGNPINMINQDVKPKPFPTARIIIEKSNSASIKPEVMSEFYSIIFVLIEMLENRGVRCEVWTTINAYEGKEIESVNLKIKNYMQPLNIYKIQFPIIASDFLRRIGLRLTEINPDIQDSSWCFGYGKPLSCMYSEKEIKELLEIEDADIYIPSCQKMDYRQGQELDESLKEIIKRTNLKNYIDLI